MIDGEDEICLTPNQRYSKIPNISSITTIPALKTGMNELGSKILKVFGHNNYNEDEQRKTRVVFFDENLRRFFRSK